MSRRAAHDRPSAKRHPQADLAHRFIAFATRPDRQADQARRIPYGPLRKAALDRVDSDLSRWLPTAPENMVVWLKLDARFWLDHREALERRFDELVSGSQ